jgi:ferrochelatase
MYPQYSATTVAANYDAVFKHFLNRRWVPTLRVVEPYFRHPAYIAALAATINEGLAKLKSRPEYLVFSYHGIPESYVDKGDPYCCMCTETTRLLKPLLNMPADRVIHTYQSRFGRDPWLVPYTDETIDALAEKGVKHIAVACPGFTADCLETLDEIGNEGREAFEEKGGHELSLIACLNDHPEWVEAMYKITKAELNTWLETPCEAVSFECPVAKAKKVAVV